MYSYSTLLLILQESVGVFDLKKTFKRQQKQTSGSTSRCSEIHQGMRADQLWQQVRDLLMCHTEIN